MKVIDLHCHSYESDGVLSPLEVVVRAKANHVDVLALTDHDTLAGVRALRAEVDLPLQLISGLEISTAWQGKEIHVVGLHVDENNQELENALIQQRAKRLQRGEQIKQKLLKAKEVEETWDHLALMQGEVLCRPHLARQLISEKYPSMNKVFKKLLAKGGKAYVKGEWMSIAEAVNLIMAAGGYAVLAHPGRYQLSRGKMLTLLEDFSDAGGHAIEVVYPNQQVNDRRHLASMCEKFGLAASKGSDFHSPDTTWLDLGRLPALPEGCQPVWELWQ